MCKNKMRIDLSASEELCIQIIPFNTLLDRSSFLWTFVLLFFLMLKFDSVIVDQKKNIYIKH